MIGFFVLFKMRWEKLGGEKMKILRTRDEKENHIEMLIIGEKSEEIGREIRAALQKMKCRHEVSYCITVKDSLQ